MRDGPTFCWHCGGKLQQARSGAWLYRQVRDPLGHLHRVHGVCLPDAVGDGIEEVPDNDMQSPAKRLI